LVCFMGFLGKFIPSLPVLNPRNHWFWCHWLFPSKLPLCLQTTFGNIFCLPTSSQTVFNLFISKVNT
jgi:hypothetical protein